MGWSTIAKMAMGDVSMFQSRPFKQLSRALNHTEKTPHLSWGRALARRLTIRSTRGTALWVGFPLIWFAEMFPSELCFTDPEQPSTIQRI